MKAVLCPRYGGPEVLEVRDVPVPEIADDEILVKVKAASVNALDWHVMTADVALVRLYTGLFKPKKVPIMGADIAGVVEKVGAKVTRFKVGDKVFGDISATGNGGFSEYAAAKESVMAHMSGRSFKAAAALPVAGLTALQGLRDWGNLQPGQHVLVIGASGGVGHYAVQVAKAMGATVTAVTSTSKIDMVRALGADHVIDRLKQDPADAGPFDMVFDCGAFRPPGDYRKAMAERGTYVMVGGSGKAMMQVMLFGGFIFRGDQRSVCKTAKAVATDLEALDAMLKAGTLRPVIDKEYPLAKTADALRHLGSGDIQGKIIIRA